MKARIALLIATLLVFAVLIAGCTAEEGTKINKAHYEVRYGDISDSAACKQKCTATCGDVGVPYQFSGIVNQSCFCQCD
jgi:hypothetical protein